MRITNHRPSLRAQGLIWITAAITVASLWSGGASACAICQCGDPTLTAMGAEKPFAGRLRLSAEWRHRTERVGIAPGMDETLSESRLALSGAYAPSDWLFLSIDLPMARRTLDYPNLGRDLNVGFGDASLTAKVFLFKDRDFRPRHLGGILTGLTVPLASHQARLDSLDAQLGTGAWTPQLGLWYAFYNDPVSIYLSSTLLAPLGGWNDLEAGGTVLSTLEAQWQPLNWLGLRASLDTRASRADRYAGQLDKNSGGFIAFVSPGAVVSPMTDLLVHARVRIPTVSALEGDHEEGAYFEAGVTHDF